MSLNNATQQLVNMTSLISSQIDKLALQVGNIPIYSQPLVTSLAMPQILKRNILSRDHSQGSLTNKVIIQKKSYSNGGLERVIETYIEDEYLVHSMFLCAISVLSFWPSIFFLNKQRNLKIGPRMFDQMMLYALMAITVAHFMCE